MTRTAPQIKSLQDENQALKARITSLEEDNAAQEQALDENEARIASLEEKHNTSVTQSLEAFQHTSTEKRALQSQIDSFDDRNAAHEQDLDEKNSLIASLEDDNATLMASEAALEQDARRLQAHITSLEEKNAYLTQSQEEYQAERASY